MEASKDSSNPPRPSSSSLDPTASLASSSPARPIPISAPPSQYDEALFFSENDYNISPPILPSSLPFDATLTSAGPTWTVIWTGDIVRALSVDKPKRDFRPGEPIVFRILENGEVVAKSGIIHSAPVPERYHLNWDDGGVGEYHQSIFLDYPRDYVPTGERLPVYNARDRIEFRVGERFHPGIVLKRLPDFTYEIGFGRDGKQLLVKEEDLRLYGLWFHKFAGGDDIDLKWKGSDTLFRGIIKSESGRNKYMVALSNGQIESEVSCRDMFLVSRPPENAHHDSVAEIIRGDVVYIRQKVSEVPVDEGKVTFANSDGTLAILLNTGSFWPQTERWVVDFIERPLQRRSSNQFKDFRPGDFVRARWKGHHYLSGKIAAINSDRKTYKVDFIEKPSEENIPYFDIVLSKKAEDEELEPVVGLKVGDPVDAKYKGGDFVPGWISGVNADGTYAIEFDDGALELRQPANQIKKVSIITGGGSISAPLKLSGKFFPGQNVRAKWRDGMYHLAKVIAENFDGTFSIRFNNGTFESSIPSSQITTDLEEKPDLFSADFTKPSIALNPPSDPSPSTSLEILPLTFRSKPTTASAFDITSSLPLESPTLSSSPTKTSLKPASSPLKSPNPPISPRVASDKTYRIFDKGIKVLSINNWRYFKDGIKFGEVGKQADGSYRVADVQGNLKGEWKNGSEIWKGTTKVAEFDGKELKISSKPSFRFEGSKCLFDGKTLFDIEGLEASDPIPLQLICLWIILFR